MTKQNESCLYFFKNEKDLGLYCNTTVVCWQGNIATTNNLYEWNSQEHICKIMQSATTAAATAAATITGMKMSSIAAVMKMKQ